MKITKLFFILLFFCLYNLPLFAQHTFSIVAVDPTTGEVGGAGATCLDIVRENATALIINDLIPGKGAIHTQSFWNENNQKNARREMEAGLNSMELMDWLENNDAQGRPQSRQYGAAAFDDTGGTNAAAFTGSDCFDDKYHIVGDYYAIQGNILIDSSVIDSMEAFFLRATGPLSDRLMEAMQGANITGADVRCFSEGVSSRSSFIRVAKPGDTLGTFYLDLHVPVTPTGIDPIDQLQEQFDDWKTLNSVENPKTRDFSINIYPNPAETFLHIESNGSFSGETYYLEINDCLGRKVKVYNLNNRNELIDINDFQRGIYFLQFMNISGKLIQTKKLILN